MLSCKKCGAEMSGVDLVCKKCGTPWGKTGKSKSPLFFSLFLVIAFTFIFLYFVNPSLLGFDKQPIDIQEEQNNPTTEQPTNDNDSSIQETPNIEENPPLVEDPPVEILPPNFTSINASSSTKPYSSFSYDPSKTVDNDNTTAWLEGVKGHGINEWIEFSADSEQYVNGIIIYNGYQKNKTTYINNGKIKKIRLTFSDNSNLEYELPTQTFEESQNGVDIKFDTQIKTTSIRFTILSVDKGAYYEDTGVNEIVIY